MFSSGWRGLLSILALCRFSSISVLPAATMPLRTFSPSPILSLILSLHRSVSVPRFGIGESFRTKRKHLDFQRDGGGQRKLVDHADVDNRATGANLHTSILTNFSSARRRRFQLPSLAPLHPCIRTDLCGGVAPTTVFPGSAGLSRDLVEIRNVLWKNLRYEFARSCNRLKMKPPFKYRPLL